MLCRFLTLCRDLNFLKNLKKNLWLIITFRLVKFEYYVWEQMNKYIEVIFTELKFNIHVVLVFMDTWYSIIYPQILCFHLWSEQPHFMPGLFL